MIFAPMHRFVKFRDGRYKACSFRNPEVGGPMFHLLEKVDKPLAGNVVAEDDERNGAGVVDHKGHNVVHIAVSA